ncbi:MAG: nucleotidyltransferase domain-containing protein [Gammaproteobacteria bacterium]|nr:nucleotidyltransferase domain-containing protein [Gammaproteobacteria bacterium]
MPENKTQLDVGVALFGKARRGVLELLFGHPDRGFYLREIIKHAGAGTSQVQKELTRLVAAGLLLREQRGNLVYFRANPQAGVFDELRGIVTKTFGIVDQLQAALAPFADRLDLGFIYGSVARGTASAASDVDLFLVGDVRLSEVVEEIAEVETKLKRTISPTIYSPAEFSEKVRKRDHFTTRVLEQPKLFLVGDDHVLRKLTKSRKARIA